MELGTGLSRKIELVIDCTRGVTVRFLDDLNQRLLVKSHFSDVRESIPFRQSVGQW